jgi:multidrug efflux system membrane fusion protein
MTSKLLVGAVALIVVAVAAGTYSPERVDSFAPRLGPYAHRLHDLAFPAPPAPVAAATQGPPPILVSVAPVRRIDVPDTIEGLGQIQAFNTVTVRSRVDGQILKIGFEEGADVKADDLIAQIDPRPFKAALDAADAKKVQDEANLANARLDLQRYSSLAKQSYATQQQLDTQQSLVNQLTATVAADAAAIDAAQVQLNYTTVRAPISGRAGLRLIDEGNMVSAAQQTGIVTLSQIEPIAGIFTAPQDDLPQIAEALKAGAPAVAAKTAEGKTLAVGKLIVIDSQVDPATATIKLKAEFANTDRALWPGLAVTTSLTVGVGKNVLTMPAVAVQHGQNGLYVYVVDDQGRAALRNIKVARQTPDTAVVADGVKEGERVITTGVFLLQPGAPVRVDQSGGGS